MAKLAAAFRNSEAEHLSMEKGFYKENHLDTKIRGRKRGKDTDKE